MQITKSQVDETSAIDLNQINSDQTIYEFSQEVLQIACEIGDRALEAYAFNLLGHALVAQGDLSEAVNSYQKALFIRNELEQDILAYGTISCLAKVALIQGDLETAKNHVEEIIDHLQTISLDNLDPFLTCYQVLKANHDLRAHGLINEAYELLQKQASKITDENLRHSFLNNVATNRDIVREFESKSKAVE